MIANGRQYAVDLAGIRDDHVARYRFAVQVLGKTGTTGRVIDAGSGCGYGSHMIAAAGFDVLGMEIDGQAVAYAQEHWADQAQFMEGDATIWSFDGLGAVVAFEVLEHIAEAATALDRWKTPLLIGSVPNQDVTPFDPKRQTYHVRHYTPGELHALLAATGWTLKRMATQKAKRGPSAAVVDGEDGMTLVFVATK